MMYDAELLSFSMKSMNVNLSEFSVYEYGI